MKEFELKYKSDLGTATTMYAYAKESNDREMIQSLELIFPELKESKDERIRKWLIGVIKSNEYGSISNVGEMPCSKPDIIAWIEKQGKKKFADIKDIKNKAHQIGWEISKHYDPNASKQEWCEMAAIDMACWLEEQDE